MESALLADLATQCADHIPYHVALLHSLDTEDKKKSRDWRAVVRKADDVIGLVSKNEILKTDGVKKDVRQDASTVKVRGSAIYSSLLQLLI